MIELRQIGAFLVTEVAFVIRAITQTKSAFAADLFQNEDKAVMHR